MKDDPKSATPEDVDAYMAALPADVKAMLEKLRKAILSAAPRAEEVISYGMPTYKYLGNLVHFAAFKNHCALFGAGKNILKIFKDEVEPFLTSSSSLRFSVGNPLPAALVKKIIKHRIRENEEVELAKKRK
jgi:uncharacterized protein YdhG (YjbR/CyaY superfamily)